VFNMLWVNGVINLYVTLLKVIIVVFNYYTSLLFIMPNGSVL